MEDHETKDFSNVPSTSDSDFKAVVKIKQDHNLILSTSLEGMENRIKCYVKYYDLKYKLNCVIPAFPSDYALAHLSSMSYNEMKNQKDLLDGWILLSQAYNTGITNGYCGSAYFNVEHQQIVIAHRGTDSLSAVWTDLKGIVFSKFVSQMNSAITFTDIILSLIKEFNQRGAYLKLSLTGHSLGGWLAQVTTFTAKYLVKDDESNRFLLVNEIQIGYHAHCVVFESPGCKVMLERLKAEYVDYRYDHLSSSQIGIDALDITTYLSAPNRINCCCAHVGKLYRVFVDLSDQKSDENVSSSWGLATVFRHAAKFARQHFLHTVYARGIDRIISCFDPQTGFVKRDVNGKLEVQEVLIWPIIPIIEFSVTGSAVLNWVSKFLYCYPVDESYGDMGEIRYHTKDFNENILKLNVFNETEIYLVHGYNICSFFHKYESIIFSVDTDDSKFVLNSAFKKLDLMKFEIDRENLVLLDPNVEPSYLISYVKQLNHFFPNLNREKRATKDFLFDLVLEIYKTESFEYLTPIRENLLEFCIDTFNLSTFLNEIDSQVLLQVEENTSAGALKIFKLIEGKNGYDNSDSMFLDVEMILKLKQLSFATFIKKIEKKYLLVIETNDNSEEALDCLKEIIVKVRENNNIKFILIVDKSTEADWTEIVGDHEISPHEGIQLSDLNSDTRKQILNRELVNLQGSRVSLAQIIPQVEALKSVKDLIQLATATNRKLDVGSDYIENSRFDIFAVSNISLEEFQNIIPPGERVTLYKDWDQSVMVRFVVLDKFQAQNQFQNICWHFSQKSRIHWLKFEESRLILRDSWSHCDRENDDFIEMFFTEQLKTPVREVLNGCFVTGKDQLVSSCGRHVLKSIISTKILMKLGSQEELKAGSELPKLGEMKDYYVERSLTTATKCIFPRSLKCNESAIFAIGNINIYDLLRDTGISDTDFVMPYKQWLLTRKFSKTRFIILDVKDVEGQFKNICECYPDKNIHWLIRVVCCHSFKVSLHTLEDDPLHYDTQTSVTNVMFKLEKSRVCPDKTNDLDLRDGLVVYKECTNIGAYNEMLSIDNIRDDFVTVIGKPGMGKSTFFTHLALQKKKFYPFLWVIKLKLHTITWDSLDKLERPFTKEQVVDFLVKIVDLESEFEKSLFEYCLHDEKVVLILDAFDEVSPKYDDQIFGLLETLQTEMKVKQLWLSSRPYALKDGQSMGTVYTLQGFNGNDQENFLLMFWGKKLKVDLDVDKCSDFSRNLLDFRTLYNERESVAEIPFILMVIAEYYQNEFETFYKSKKSLYTCSRLQQISIHTFYEKVMEKKIGVIYREKFGIEVKQQVLDAFFTKWRKTLNEDHKLLALASCHLDSLVAAQKIVINGLLNSIDNGEEMTGFISSVENGVPQFIHATFAEHFASVWLIEQMIATKDKARFVKLFEGLCDLLLRDSNVVYSLVSSQLSDNQILKEKLKTCLQDNKHLVKFLSKVSENYLNIFRFLISLDVDNETLRSRSDELIVHGVEMEDIDIIESFCRYKYGDACDYASIILNYQLLFRAARTNFRGSTMSFLLSKFSTEGLRAVVNKCNKNGEIALHVAAMHNRLEVAKVLLKNRAEVGLRNSDEYTALDVAIAQLHKEMVKLLLYNWVINSPLDLVKTSEYIRDDDLNVIFMNFIEKCFWKNSGSPIIAVDALSQSNSCDPVGSPEHSLIKSLMSIGAGEIRGTEYNLTLLLHSERPVVDVSDIMNAASHYKGNEKLLIALIGNVALKYPNYLSRLFCSMDGRGNTLLHMAAKLGLVATAELMIGLGADTNIRNSDGDTALSVAEKYGKYAFFLWLLFREDEAINKAVSSGDLIQSGFTADSLSEIIVKHSSDQSQLLTKRYDGGDTMLNIAAQFNLVRLAEMIIDRGADINVQNDDNHTPLSLACKNGRLEMTNLLINKGASINDDQQSPLLWAIHSCSHAIARFLIENGAVVNAKLPFAHADNESMRKWTPLQLLVNRCQMDSKRDKRLYKDLAKILIFNGADVSTCFDYFPFHTAGTCAELFVLLIMCGVGIDAANSEGSLVTYLEKHRQSNDPNDQKILRSVFLYSNCQRPEQLKERISYSKHLDFALNYEKRMQEKIPQFCQLLNACKAKNITNIQQKLRDLLVDEIALNRAFNGIAKSLLSEFPDKVANRNSFTSILFECMELIEVSVSLLIKRDVVSPLDFSLYGKLKFLSEQCRK